MSNWQEAQYLEMLYELIHNGQERQDRTGVGTLSNFNFENCYHLSEGFPLFTTKFVSLKSVLSELLWFIEGSGDERRLAEILYGKPREELTDKTTIWTQNLNAAYWKPKAKFEGDLGVVYGKMWRQWPKSDGTTVDQIANLIDGLKNDPHGRRHILSAWNPAEFENMALPPCHVLSQFYVHNDGRLDCLLHQRSGDAFLGIPYNTTSYALLTCMIAKVCGLTPGVFYHKIGDAHVYKNHVEACEEQMKREPFQFPTLVLPDVDRLEDFTMDNVYVENYNHHPAIKAPMAV